jgi:hypothetical protein
VSKTYALRLYISLAFTLLGVLFFFKLVRADGMFFVYLPLVEKQATPTPTRTPTPTVTPTQPPAAQITGSLALCNPAQTVYGQTEKICVIEIVYNGNPYPVSYGIVGVSLNQVSGGSASWFQTSWDSKTMCAFCTGPTDGGKGPWQDNLRGPSGDPGVKPPGEYRLYLAICLSDVSTCQTPNGNWKTLNPSGLLVTVQ